MFMYSVVAHLHGRPAKVHKAMQWTYCSRWLLVVVVFALGVSSKYSEAQSSLQQRTEFAREVNRYRWSSETNWNTDIGRWRVDVINRFQSDAYIQFDNRLRFRDEDRLDISALRPIGRKIDASIRGGLDWFGSSRASSQSLLFGVQMKPVTALKIEPLVGIASDRRPGIVQGDQGTPLRIDTGPAVGLSAVLDPREIQGYRVSFQSNAAWQRIAPRRIGDLALAAAAARSFGLARLESGVSFSSRRRDTYQAASFLNRGQVRDPESIEATTSDTLDINFLVRAPIVKGLRIIAQADVRLNQRRIRIPRVPEESITFETNFARQALTGQVSLHYEREQIDARLRAEYGAINERRVLSNREELPPSEAAQKRTLLQQADYDEGVFALSGSIRGAVTPTLTILFTGSSRIVRHDTPIVNLDDRDEVYHTGTLALNHRRSRYLRTELRLFGSYHHTVFLNAERSAENSVQRTLRLRPSMEWTPASFTSIRLTSEVRATYTTEDFVLPGRKSSDQSAREMRLESDMEHRILADTDLKLTASFSDLRLGRLRWESFTEIPFDTLRTYSVWLRVQTGRRLRGELGWRTFLRSDYDRAITVQYQLPNSEAETTQGSITRSGKRWVIQTGPSGAVSWTRGRTTLQLDAWANWQRLRYRLYGQLPDASEQVIKRTARKGTRRLIPLIALRIFWQI